MIENGIGINNVWAGETLPIYNISRHSGVGKEDAMDIKMIVCDLDSTLLRTDKTVSKRTLEAIERCRGQGIIFAIATARSEKFPNTPPKACDLMC